jgi:hypothetical protein
MRVSFAPIARLPRASVSLRSRVVPRGASARSCPWAAGGSVWAGARSGSRSVHGAPRLLHSSRRGRIVTRASLEIPSLSRPHDPTGCVVHDRGLAPAATSGGGSKRRERGRTPSLLPRGARIARAAGDGGAGCRERAAALAANDLARASRGGVSGPRRESRARRWQSFGPNHRLGFGSCGARSAGFACATRPIGGAQPSREAGRRAPHAGEMRSPERLTEGPAHAGPADHRDPRVRATYAANASAGRTTAVRLAGESDHGGQAE